MIKISSIVKNKGQVPFVLGKPSSEWGLCYLSNMFFSIAIDLAYILPDSLDPSMEVTVPRDITVLEAVRFGFFLFLFFFYLTSTI